MLSIKGTNKHLLSLLALYPAFVRCSGALLQVFVAICGRTAGSAGVPPLTAAVCGSRCPDKNGRKDCPGEYLEMKSHHPPKLVFH
jgi:hypothetical protein